MQMPTEDGSLQEVRKSKQGDKEEPVKSISVQRSSFHSCWGKFHFWGLMLVLVHSL